MSRIEDLRAQLELAEIEQELIDAKAAANTPEVQKAATPDLTEIKEKVRAAREAARSARPTPAPVPAEEETE
jgi:hypothetical protein